MAITTKQEHFCQLVALGHGYGEAYSIAYETAHNRNSDAAWKLKKNPEIERRIIDIRVEAFKPVAKPLEFLLEFWFRRMIYDPREIIGWFKRACRHCHGEGFAYQWRLPEFMEKVADAEARGNPLPDIGGGFGFNATRPPHKDCPNCDGKGVGRTDISDTSDLSLSAQAGFDGIKETKEGTQIMMADRGKAAEQFAKLSGLEVVQVRQLAEPIPDAEEMARLRNDPDAARRVYQRVMAGASGRAPTKH